jgi:hypothetical protein
LLDLLHSLVLLRQEQRRRCPRQQRTLSAAPTAPSSKSGAATVMVIWAVVAIITAGAAVTATTMVGGIAIDGDLIASVFDEKARRQRRRVLFFSNLIAHDRKHRLDRCLPVALKGHRPRRLCSESPRQKRPASSTSAVLSNSQTNVALRTGLGPSHFNRRFGGIIVRNGGTGSHPSRRPGR